MSYGTPKESSSSTPSESSGFSSSEPSDPSSEGSSGFSDLSSGSSGIFDSSSSGPSSSGGCSFYVHEVTLGSTDDEMFFTVFNDGAGVLEITGIISALPGVTLDPDTPLPIFLLSGTGIVITVQSNPPATDLRGTGFTVQTDCGDQSEVVPV